MATPKSTSKMMIYSSKLFWKEETILGGGLDDNSLSLLYKQTFMYLIRIQFITAVNES